MIWKPVTGYEGKYEVSRDGRVRKPGGKDLGQFANSDGYMQVRVSQPRRVLKVHRLVALAHVPNPEGLPVVNHKDCRLENNAADNLEWCTQKGNVNHSRSLGRYPDYWKGKRSPNANLSDETVKAIIAFRSETGASWEKIGAQFGVSKRTVGRILMGKTYLPATPIPETEGTI